VPSGGGGGGGGGGDDDDDDDDDDAGSEVDFSGRGDASLQSSPPLRGSSPSQSLPSPTPSLELAAALEADMAALDVEIGGLRASLAVAARRTTASIIAQAMPQQQSNHGPSGGRHLATEVY
jgi:hypothetical protein